VRTENSSSLAGQLQGEVVQGVRDTFYGVYRYIADGPPPPIGALQAAVDEQVSTDLEPERFIKVGLDNWRSCQPKVDRPSSRLWQAHLRVSDGGQLRYVGEIHLEVVIDLEAWVKEDVEVDLGRKDEQVSPGYTVRFLAEANEGDVDLLRRLATWLEDRPLASLIAVECGPTNDRVRGAHQQLLAFVEHGRLFPALRRPSEVAEAIKKDRATPAPAKAPEAVPPPPVIPPTGGTAHQSVADTAEVPAQPDLRRHTQTVVSPS
jgi:hypothetical protein